MIRTHLFDMDLTMLPCAHCDVLIIGTGIAGLSCALAAAPTSHVVVITKDTIAENNTAYAQGGVAAALGPEDSPELHASDTLAAGDGLSDSHTVSRLVNEGPERIRELLNLGARFDEANGALALGQEAAHSSRRIAHAGGDATGREIHRTLSQAARLQVGIALRERTLLVDLLVAEGHAIGALLLHLDTEQLSVVLARQTVLASGGIGAVYSRTTNPLVTTGDGIAAAYRAGARVADMEFVQFHPTALATADNPLFLVSEAVRGEGAILRDADGVAFMPEYHPRAELGPRDVVARAIYDRCQRAGTNHVLLDCSPIGAEKFERRFPTILRACLTQGMDPRREPIRVTPAAHYHMGGVRVDADSLTSLPGLWAAGECSCTGVHGANRLASNSLLEGLVFGSLSGLSAARRSRTEAQEQLRAAHPPHGEPAPPAPPPEEIDQAIDDLRELMWSKVGIIRSREGLEEALSKIEAQLARYRKPTLTRRGVELANMLTVGWLIARGALRREESRGAHYRADRPERDDDRWLCHITNRLEPQEGSESARSVEELQEVQA
ncbi:MAG: L-aspartate oxidase [Armatimonadota bacterium]|nr:L-aspartate oxidase [Acidobacteriota bacterium]